MTNWAIQILYSIISEPHIVKPASIDWFVLLNIATKANIAVPPGDNNYTDYRMDNTKNCYAPVPTDFAPGLEYLDTPDLAYMLSNKSY